MKGKYIERRELVPLVQRLKAQGKGIVFTNGCFDILHAGHVRYLREAKSLGDVLIVGVNSDESVARIKPERPITPLEQRIEVLSALEMVDYVTVFDEDTPLELIKQIRPDLVVKGGDWPEDQIVGREFAKGVKRLSYLEGISTSLLIQRIIDRYCKK